TQCVCEPRPPWMRTTLSPAPAMCAAIDISVVVVLMIAVRSTLGGEGFERLAEIGFDDLGMRDDVARIALEQLLSEVEYEDVLRQRDDDVDQVLDHQDGHALGVDAPEQLHQFVDIGLR